MPHTATFSKRNYLNYVQAILFAILNLGSARNPHVLCVRSGFCALSASKLAATITPGA
ncbi:L-asparaginase [Yersinia bercovieri]|uniref:L-asparaginase n=1 Tax=Yersinia bercovieri TaxID=634 RepID=A0A2G4U7H7_YERBE|nr:L-asparaginase [Yersinia bercovieri]